MLVVVTVADIGANDKPLDVVFTVAYCCTCCCAPPLFDLSNSIVIYALFISIYEYSMEILKIAHGKLFESSKN